jgi:hypothetical protein
MRHLPAWIWFVVVQLISLIAMAIGWALLIPFCIAQAWAQDAISIKDGRIVDTWDLSLIQAIYGNREDGVSGQQAIVFTTGVAGPWVADGKRIQRTGHIVMTRQKCKYQTTAWDGASGFWGRS